jgi:hypothetical protein
MCQIVVGVSFFFSVCILTFYLCLFCGYQKRADGNKHAAAVTNKKKKDKVVGATGKTIRSETSMASVAPRVKSELTLAELYILYYTYSSLTID